VPHIYDFLKFVGGMGLRVGVANYYGRWSGRGKFLDQSIGVDESNTFQFKFFRMKIVGVTGLGENCGRHRFLKIVGATVFSMKIVDATGLVSIKIVGAIGLGGLWALKRAWSETLPSVC